jgi:Animal haem peroxidase
VESVAGIASAVADAPETQAVANAISDPSAPPNVVTDVVSKVLSSVGLNPFASDNPVAPVDSPAMWAMLAWARRRAQEPQLPSSFGRLFPVGETSEYSEVLPPLNQQTNEQLAELAQGMLEGVATDNPKGTSAGITFFGQFIDHDLTLDNEPQPTDTVDVEGLVNGRSFAFDLDSVYGGGPKKSPQLYDGDKFLIGTAADGVSPDLPRNPDGSAILVEHRNDENLIIAQIHVSFLRLHNSLIDQGMSFDQARQTVVDAYRYVVLNDYLPQIVGQAAVDQALRRPVNAGFYDPGSKDAPMTPVEFSTAAFRFGHSQVRNAYAINDTSGGVRVFSLDPAVPDLRGGRQLPANLIIDFNNFFSELPRATTEDPALIGRAIDTKISPSLFELPIPGAEGGGSNVLAFRNLVRAKFYDVPSGEDIAGAMGVEVVGEPEFDEGTPLWYYVLREAELTTGGAELGPVGGGIVAEVFVDLLRMNGGIKTVEKPNLADVSGGDFRVGDLLVAADQPQIHEPRRSGRHHLREPQSGRHHLREPLEQIT